MPYLDRRYVVPFVLVVVLLACNQGGGVTALLGYSVKVFQEAGLRGAFANGADLVFKLTMFGSTILSCDWIETKGRKPLLAFGTVGSLVGLLIAGGAFLALDCGLVEPSAATGWAVALGMTVLVAAFAVGPGVCCWLVTAELLPRRIRAVGMGVALLFGYGVSTGLQATFLPVAEKAGFAVLFGILACFALVYFLVVMAFMPETKGKSLEEIEKFFAFSHEPEAGGCGPDCPGDIAVVPLAFPIFIGPATTGALVILHADANDAATKVITAFAWVAAVGGIGGMLMLAASLEQWLGRRGLGILMRLTALVLAALSAQMIMTGAMAFLRRAR